MATSIKLPPDLKERLDRVASAQRRSAHWIMLEAIRDYVEREEARAASGRQQTWTSFQDRVQDEIAPPVDADEALRRYAEAKTPLDKFLALAGAGAATSGFKSKEDIDDYVRRIRER